MKVVQSLSPGYFPFVMAASIISAGTFLLGPSWLAQLVFFRSSLAAGFRAPARVFGFFAVAAGLNVVGIRLAVFSVQPRRSS